MRESGWERDDFPDLYRTLVEPADIVALATPIWLGGVVITGNEDGGKHCAAHMLDALSHIGFTTPPPADTSWNGEARPGPSSLDDDRGARNHPEYR